MKLQRFMRDMSKHERHGFNYDDPTGDNEDYASDGGEG